MIKKILIAVAMATACLAPVALTASPANAVSCVSKSKTITVDVYATTPGGFADGQWEDTVRMNYRVCDEPNTMVCDATHCWWKYDTLAYFDSLTLTHTRQWGDCGTVDQWKWNPNAIGSTDPTARTYDCGGNETVVWNPAAVKITPGATDAQKCIGITLTKIRFGLSDSTQSFPTQCVTFTM